MLDAQEIKERLGQEARHIILSGLGQQEKGGKIRCPYHSDDNPSMSWFKEGLMYRCHACSETLDIYRYLEDYKSLDFREAVEEVARMVGVDTGMKPKPIIASKKQFDKPKIKQYDLSKEAIDYMKLRGLNEETLKEWNVKQTNKFGEERYVFNYYDENKELTFVSYRHIGKAKEHGDKGGCEKNTKAILFGMDKIDKDKPLVITEGQIDAMIVWQSGYKNVVSVPSGSNNLTWIDHNWDWLQEIKEFIVWADNDEPGLKMAQKIQSKLKNVKVIVADEGEGADANVLHFRKGPEAVVKLIEDAINETPNGIIDLARSRYRSKIEVQDDAVESGFREIDAHIKDFKMGELTVVFGRNGEGKTTFISQGIAHSMQKGQKVFLYNGELSEQKTQEWIYNQVVGPDKAYKRTIDTKYGLYHEIKPDVVKSIKEWHRDTLYMFDNNYRVEGKKNQEILLEVMEQAVRRYDIEIFVIDNLMSVLETNDSNINSDQSKFVQDLLNFATQFNVHVILVAHPNKIKTEIKQGETMGNLEKNDISGSNNIANKADNIIAVERFWDIERMYDAVITVLKDRETGQRKAIHYLFDPESLRFYSDKTPLKIEYGWKKLYKKDNNVYKPNPDLPF